jgi:cytochrome b6-f complex iron-sulfur subunit
MKISRRDFFVKSAGVFALISTSGLVSTVISSCSNDPSGPSNVSPLATVPGTVANNELSISLGTSSPITNKGTTALAQYNNGNDVVIVEHNSDDTFRALSAICTHQGCVLTDFDATNNQFVCPCHGSKFDMSGNVVRGPAGSKLRELTTRVENNDLIVSL